MLRRLWFGLVLVAAPRIVRAEDAPAPDPATAPAVSPAAPAEGSEDWWKMLDTLPPRRSFDVGVGFGFSDITYFRGNVPPWIGFNAQANVGVHVGEQRHHRIGAGLFFGLEGPFPEYFTAAIEPRFVWDTIRGHLLLGATASPALLLHSKMTLTGQDAVVQLSPSLALHFGTSQPWSRLSKRLYVELEPHVRWVADRPSPGVALIVGSGIGR